MPSHVKYTQTKNDVIYLQSFDDTYLVLTLLFHLILTRMSWLQLRKETLHFILGVNGNYDFHIKIGDFHIKIGLCRFVGFVNDVTNCGCLVYVFCFRIKEKEKDTFNIKFDSIMFVQFFFSHSFN